MKRHLLVALLVVLTVALVVAAVVASGTLAQAGSATTSYTATLSAFNEVPPKYNLTTGTFTATFVNNTLQYQLTYPAQPTAVEAAHIHFGQPGVNGGIVVFLCGGGGTPVCPPNGGTVTGTLTSANVATLAAQGIKAGDFEALRQIIVNGLAYANIHTVQFPEGALRGQIMPATMSTATPSPMASASATSSLAAPGLMATPAASGTATSGGMTGTATSTVGSGATGAMGTATPGY